MACNVTAGSGMSRGLEDALGAKVQGKLQSKYWVPTIHFPFQNSHFQKRMKGPYSGLR